MFDFRPPLFTHRDKIDEHVKATVVYNSTGQQMDIWQPAPSDHPAPVLIFVPGGAWMFGHRRPQGYALMSHLVEQGWLCLAIDYRTAPINRWPLPFIDVLNALKWARDHASEYGGDPRFVAIAGASAGGHMASLAGLAWDHPTFYTWPASQPDAVVSLYGVYDWRWHQNFYHQVISQLLELIVVGKSPHRYPEIFHDASPIKHVRPDAPPFMLVQGTSDWLTPPSGARLFHKRLSAVSESAVDYLEISGGAHGFDLVHGAQTEYAVNGIAEFLNRAWESIDLREAS